MARQDNHVAKKQPLDLSGDGKNCYLTAKNRGSLKLECMFVFCNRRQVAWLPSFNTLPKRPADRSLVSGLGTKPPDFLLALAALTLSVFRPKHELHLFARFQTAFALCLAG